MQEIRSSTTQLARLCEKLSAESRLMISGTPLYTSIDDLNGELNFLGVYPFCLNDATDGFWGSKIGRPWKEDKDPASVALLDLLLKGVMMRHSKCQVYASSVRFPPIRSILSLPPATKSYVGLNFGDYDDPLRTAPAFFKRQTLFRSRHSDHRQLEEGKKDKNMLQDDEDEDEDEDEDDDNDKQEDCCSSGDSSQTKRLRGKKARREVEERSKEEETAGERPSEPWSNGSNRQPRPRSE